MPPGEMRVHLLLCSHELAPSLLARFQNGLIYRYLRGSTPSHKDFDQTPLWKGIARKLGEWHAVLSASGLSYAHSTARQADQAKRNSMHSKAGSTNGTAQNGTPVNGYTPTNEDSTRPNPDLETKIRGQTYDAALMRIRESQGAEALEPDLWSVTLQWIFALPNGSEAARARQERLLDELLWAVKTLMRKPAKNGTEVSLSTMYHSTIRSSCSSLSSDGRMPLRSAQRKRHHRRPSPESGPRRPASCQLHRL